MSVLIKGMKMPSCCDVCTFSDWSNLHQTACCKMRDYEPCFEDHSMDYTEKRADFCPLIEVPEPHGDLIDRDAFTADYGMADECRNCKSDPRSCEFDRNYTKLDFCGWLDNAPVIIERSENHDD